MIVEHDDKIDLTFCIPCLDNEKNIVGTISSIREAMAKFDYSYEIIVIDDYSMDKSAKLVEDYKSENPDVPIIFISNKITKGLGYGYVKGAVIGKGKYYKVIHSGNIERKEGITQYIQNLGKADIVTCYLNDNRNLFRRLLSKFYTSIISLISGYSLKYYQGSTLVHRDDVLQYHPHNTGNSFLAEFLVILLDNGRSVKELEVRPRMTNSKSKAISWRNGISAFQCFANIVFRRLYR